MDDLHTNGMIGGQVISQDTRIDIRSLMTVQVQVHVLLRGMSLRVELISNSQQHQP